MTHTVWCLLLVVYHHFKQSVFTVSRHWKHWKRNFFFFLAFVLFLSFNDLPSEDVKEGAAERDGNRSAAPAEIHTRLHTSLEPDEVFPEVEVYIEHLGEVRGYWSFPPLHKDLCPLQLLLPTPTSTFVRPSPFMFPLFSLLHSEQTTSLRTAFIAARHHRD